MMNNENKLTILQAFNAMRLFLEKHYQRTHSEELDAFLVDLCFLQNGSTADPAAWPEWEECFNQALKEGEKKKFLEFILTPESFDDKPAFKKCVEVLPSQILSWRKSQEILDTFAEKYPLIMPYNIDWESIEKKVEIGYEKENILLKLDQLLEVRPDTTVYISWEDNMIPLIKTTLEKIIEYYDYVLPVSPTTHIFNLDQQYVIEILPNGTITLGVV